MGLGLPSTELVVILAPRRNRVKQNFGPRQALRAIPDYVRGLQPPERCITRAPETGGLEQPEWERSTTRIDVIGKKDAPVPTTARW
jgi:hypothetical protein